MPELCVTRSLHGAESEAEFGRSPIGVNLSEGRLSDRWCLDEGEGYLAEVVDATVDGAIVVAGLVVAGSVVGVVVAGLVVVVPATVVEFWGTTTDFDPTEDWHPAPARIAPAMRTQSAMNQRV